MATICRSALARPERLTTDKGIFSRMRILIADDDCTSRAVLAAVLQKNGFEVLQTTNGNEAWQILQQPQAPALAILDWVMPELDGLELVRRVRALATDRPPYLIMLTSRCAKVDVIAGLDAGANDYLTKPFDSGELRARVAVGRRMIELQEALVRSKELLAHQASHDALTGLFNRRAILARLQDEMARAQRGAALALGSCDIDHFKRINDCYGHQTGDEVLCGLARLLTEQLRPFDSLGRFGGEEFLIVAPIKNGTCHVALFDRLCRQVANTPIVTRNGPLALTLSIGVACFRPTDDLDQLLARADAALYRAKEQGRNRVVYAENGAASETDLIKS